jgi:glycosyltransferase 2 family protein
MSRAAGTPRLRSVIRWTVVIVIFWYIGRRLAQDWDALRAEDLRFDAGWMALSVLLLVGYMVGRAFVWHHLTRLLDVSIAPLSAVTAWLWSQLGKYIPGKVFLFLGRLDFYSRAGKPTGPVALAFGIELIGTFSASIATVILGLFTLDLPAVEGYRWLLVAALIGLIAVLHPVPLRLVINTLARITRRAAFEMRLPFSKTLGFVAMYTLNWLVFGAAFYALVNSFTTVGPELMLYLAGAFSFASMVGMLAVFVPSGLGVREGILGFFLSQVMTTPLALAAALVARIWFTVVEVGLALAVSAVLHVPTRSYRALRDTREVENG